ncbi:class I SAM-dependent methyltransferase [Sneathiella glossodoripedis]|uniref:class I SAM-dependent methyltransferase n=1 Tax=Sneathiella glossodoripedis TaxID=418853 RepID=UPI000559E028|nr:class I SAM-dependent methyltransferase [Sneathiella glossodoripedis]
MNFRLLRMGISTLLNIRKQGYFIPYRYADSIPQQSEKHVYTSLEEKFDQKREEFERFLKFISGFQETFAEFGKFPPPYPRWEQDWFPRLDGASAYSMVRKYKPSSIIEIGSGHSTRFMMQAVQDGELNTNFTAIDPAPRADISKLPVEIHGNIVQSVDTEIFRQLGENDILFIDSSHIAMPGSDVDHLLLTVLPILPKGVIIHIHDIMLPFAYPDSWHWRGYNEQQAVAPLLLCGFELLFSSAYVARRMKTEIEASGLDNIPLRKGAVETSLWLRKQF